MSRFHDMSQILSRVKPAVGGAAPITVSEKKKKNKGKKIPRVEDYLNQRDYLGAQTLLEVSYPLAHTLKYPTPYHFFKPK